MDIGASIKKLRIKNGITQQQLAECLNVSMQTISRWETSVTYPDVVKLPILAKYFRVTVDYLLNIGGNSVKTTVPEALSKKGQSPPLEKDKFLKLARYPEAGSGN